jgi:hypothetical protein
VIIAIAAHSNSNRTSNGNDSRNVSRSHSCSHLFLGSSTQNTFVDAASAIAKSNVRCIAHSSAAPLASSGKVFCHSYHIMTVSPSLKVYRRSSLTSE